MFRQTTKIFKIFVPILLTVLFSVNSYGYNILVVFPMASRSHHNLGAGVAKGLAEAGHNITIISAYKDNYVSKKGSFREIQLEKLLQQTEEAKTNMNVFEFHKGNAIDKMLKMRMMTTFTTIIMEEVFSNQKVEDLLNSNQKFDAIIFENFMMDALRVFAHHFDAHQILLNPTGTNAWVDHLTGNPSLPSVEPNMMLAYPEKMNFWQRVMNMFGFLSQLGIAYLAKSENQRLVEKYFPKITSFEDVYYNVSLVLQNSHPSLSYPLHSVPNMIDIAGYHIKSPKNLPKDLQDYLDNAKNGVIYFSLGSVAQSIDMPDNCRDIFIKTLAKFNESILWKYEDENLPGKPKNVMIRKWLPQESILAHPNVKLFITHGGLLSTIETVHYGVPIVAIPILGDQVANAQLAERSGYGISLPIMELEEEKVTSMIKEVLGNPKYTQNVKERSARFRDRITSPLQTAIYWVEYVIRHKGAHHLRVVSRDLTWYQLYSVDVLGFIFVVTITILLIIKKIFALIFCRKSEKKVKLS